MQRLQGKTISPGFASGTAVVLESGAELIPRRTILRSEVDAEVRRFSAALAQSTQELDEIRHRVLNELGKSRSGIFSAHLAILQDAKFSERIVTRIASELVNAEQALDREVAELCDQLARAGSPYLSERQQDIRDVGRRILGHLLGAPITTPSRLPPHSILVARELLPSDVLNVDREHLAAIITEEGGETSHAAILARALGVPAVTAVDQLLQFVRPGMELLVDGQTGHVILSPLPDESSRFAQKLQQWEMDNAQSIAAESLPCSTVDGVVIGLHANIARPEEVQQVHEHHLDGIGLLRTEFLFLDATEPPSTDFQAEIYAKIVHAARGKPVVVRTLDMAADKHPRFLASRFDHRFLPYRGLRFSLTEASLFHDQILALVRLASKSDIRILLPMVVNPQDVGQAIEIISELSANEGLTKRPPVGVMIETPAAVVLFDRLIEKADFVSIGSNDLTQYLLATDRSAIDIDGDYSILHPAVLRTVRELVLECTAARKPLSVCGEAAGDPRFACLLAGLGVRQLSISSLRAAKVRQTLRACMLARLENLARNALDCATTSEVRMVLDEHLPGIVSGPDAGKSWPEAHMQPSNLNYV